MNVKFITPVIHVSDLEKARIYYTEVLGFSVDFIFGDFLGLVMGDVAVHLCGPDNGGMRKTPGGGQFSLFCDDIDAYYAGLVAKQALISYPIGDRAYGLRDFSVDDLDGNSLVFSMDSVR